MSKRPRHNSPSIALLLAAVIAGCTGRAASADEVDIYPAAHIVQCKPAPIIGCVCAADLRDNGSIFPWRVNVHTDASEQGNEREVARIMEWTRATCTAASRPASAQQ